jgi:hypothetical protein
MVEPSINPLSHNTCNNSFAFPSHPPFIFSAVLVIAMLSTRHKSANSRLFFPLLDIPLPRSSTSSSGRIRSSTFSTRLEVGILCCKQRSLNCLVFFQEVASSTMPLFPSSCFFSVLVSLTLLKLPNHLLCRHSSFSASNNQKGPSSGELTNTRDWVSPGSKVRGKLPRYPCSCSMSVDHIRVALPPKERFIL